MNIDSLKNYDAKTASGILAAAALSATSDLEDVGPATLRGYAKEARNVVSEVRRQLNISLDDFSPRAQASINRVLAETIQNQFLPGNSLRTAINRAGQAGRVPPDFYSVDQPKLFLTKFRTLGIRASHVERVVKSPDDYQHPLSADAAVADKDVISLFVKEAPASKSGARHWLLVQTHRFGLILVVQSAWHIFADSVDLEGAKLPLDVLRAFARKFGAPLEVDGQNRGIFVEGFRRKRTAHINWKFDTRGEDFFSSIAYTNTGNPDEIQVGIGYCIELARYRSYLRDHGLMTTDEMEQFNREAAAHLSASPYNRMMRT